MSEQEFREQVIRKLATIEAKLDVVKTLESDIRDLEEKQGNTEKRVAWIVGGICAINVVAWPLMLKIIG